MRNMMGIRSGKVCIHRAVRDKGILWAALLFIITACLVFQGCANVEEESGMPVYFLSNSETRLETHLREVALTGDTQNDVMLLMDELRTTQDSLRYKAPLSYPFELNSVKVDETRITLDFDENYKKLGVSTEVLIRAAIVQTLVQLKGVKYIFFTVNGEPLVDAVGKTVGRMSEKTFIYNDGNAINTYDEVIIKLYFANEEATGLVSAYRDKFYSTNIPLELFVVEETIAGPSGQIEGLYPTINPETNVISVNTSDGVCYVNLDSGFTTTINNVPTEMAAYSLVNALTELPSVNKVQILVNGEVPQILSASTFEHNDEIVTMLENEEDIVETEDN